MGTGNGERGAKFEASTAKGFRKLVAWQRANALASAVYRTLDDLPSRDRWLASQATRAAISVPANIAEGYGRGSLGDYLRFLDVAKGSLAELEYLLLFLDGEALIAAEESHKLQLMLDQTARPLHGLWKSLKTKMKKGDWDHSGVREVGPDYVVGHQGSDWLDA